MNNQLIEEALCEVTKNFSGTEHDKKVFMILLEFLAQYPDKFSSRSKKIQIGTLDYYITLANCFYRVRYSVSGLKAPTTKPDDMVSYILEVYFDYASNDIERIKREHQLSMAAENMVGALLERYIGLTLEQYGWAWCAGDFIKAIDMIKKNSDGTWTCLQVKNRDNTENSSSSAVRTGTDIQKWARSFSKTGLTNWEKFPEKEVAELLSENAFKEFVKNYLLNAKNSTNIK